MHGPGKFVWADNKHYIGEWRDNYLCGFGVFTKPGQIYKGIIIIQF